MDKTPASEIMTEPARCVGEDLALDEAARVMLEERIGSLVVVDDEERPVGIVTDSDFSSREVGIPFSTFRAPSLLGRWIGEEGVGQIYEEASRRTVSEIMSSPVRSVEAEDTVRTVLETMLRHDIKHVPVLREGRVAGMIARHDLLRMLHRRAGS